MTFQEIIDYNAKTYCVERSWWPRFAYHFTDITNIVKILDCGFLYSRKSSQKNNLMQNDNASRQVIDMTSPDVLNYVRFYFRPLTPTQYNNEGYKHPALRFDHSINANVPVPVFLLFDLQTILQDNNTRFSEKSQAGYSAARLLSGPDDFSKLNFAKIYEVGRMDNRDEDVKYRQAEILYPESYPIRNSLKYIICRNEVERRTLLKLLKARNNKTYAEYKEKIRVNSKDLFENNGLFVNSVNYYKGQLEITFNQNRERAHFCQRQKMRNGEENLQPIPCKLNLKWVKSKDVIVYETDETAMLDYEHIGSISCNLPTYENAKWLEVNLFLDNNIMCSYDFDLKDCDIF